MNYQQAEQVAHLLADGLDEIAALVGDTLGLALEGQKLRQRAQQVREDRFRVLVVGEFKRGKSTLLNALLGDDVLPRKVAECTAVVTRIQYGDPPNVRVVFDDGRKDEVLGVADFRKRYELNLEDADDRATALDRFTHVLHAVLSFPVALCQHRVELVDSPGLGAHKSRTQRTQKFLPQADAIVFVLYAPQFLKEDESHFLESILLPMGLRNIFFVVNGWNLIDESVVRPEDADRERAELEGHIRQRLAPFCMIDGRDRSAERIFRVNALGALKARMRKPPSAALLEESGVPEFEAALQHFLVEDRARARTDVILGSLRGTAEEVNRYVATQLTLADKSVAEIEAEKAALEPKLDYLRGIRRHIVTYLQGESAKLQGRLVASFQEQIKRIEADLPAEVQKFDLKPITDRWLTWAALTDWARADEDKVGRQIERCLKPQVQRLLERRFGQWQQSVVRNEMQAVMLDVDKYLQKEAEDYQRVMREIEETIGIHASPIKVKELVERWLGSGTGAATTGQFELPTGAVLSDFGWFIGLIIAEIIAEVTLHIMTGGLSLIVTLILGGVRFGWREANLRSQLQGQIIQGIKAGLEEIKQGHAAEIRAKIQEGFGGLERKVAGNIDEEIGLIAASLQTIIDKKTAHEFSAEQERQRLESARVALDAIIARLHAGLSAR